MIGTRLALKVAVTTTALASAMSVVSAVEINLSQFSGAETVIDISEIPGGGGGGAANLPPNNWNRTVKGVRFLGGAEIGIGGRTPGEINSNPFKGSPTAGDPAGFQGASLGSWLTLFIPSTYPFSLDFQLLNELPHRIGFLFDQQRDPYMSQQPAFTAQVWFDDSTSKSYLIGAQRTQLIAFEEDRGIKSVDFLWSPQTPYGTNGPRISIDDVRFEAVPEPGALLLAGIGLAAGAYGRRRERL